jgi:hypothetical protein
MGQPFTIKRDFPPATACLREEYYRHGKARHTMPGLIDFSMC